MIKMSKLFPYKFYRCTSPLISYYDIKNAKKNSMVSVLAPSFDLELEFFSLDTLVFKNLTRYYQERVTQYAYYRKPKTRVTNDSEEFNKKYIEEKDANCDNLKDISQFIRPLPNNKTDVLKGFNYVYETNHVLGNILNNDKDSRLATYLADDILVFFNEYYKKKITPNMNYPNKTIFIPVNMWLQETEYTSTKTFTKTNKNFISLLYHIFLTKESEFKEIFNGYKIVIINFNELLILDPSIEGYIPYSELLKNFLKRCKSNSNHNNLEKDTETASEIEEIENTAEKEDKVEEIIAKTKIDIDSIPEDKKEELKKIIVSQIDKSDASDITEKDIKNISNTSELDAVLNAKMAGTTLSNYKRNEMLKEKYRTLKFKEKTIDEILTESTDYSIPTYETKTNTINESLATIKANNFEKAYNENLMDQDTLKILLHFIKCKPSLFLISDPVVEDVSDTINKLYKYTVEYEDENRKRHKFSFFMPKFYMDKYMFLNGSKWDITHQKFPYPATKIKPDEIQVCSNYNKIFMTRSGINVSPRITRLRKMFNSDTLPSFIKVFKGDISNYNKDVMSTIEYGELGKDLSRVNIGDTYIYFNHNDAQIIIKPNKNSNYIPIAINNKIKKSYYIDSTNNKIYDDADIEYGELSEFIISLIGERDKKIKEEFDNLTVGSKFMYSEATLLSRHIPLILVLSASYPLHLRGILELSKIPYEISEKRVNIDKSKQGIIQFSDSYLIYDRYPYENSLLLNGLSAVNTKEYTFNDMNTRDTYIDIFDTLFGSRTIIDGLENFHYLFMDPITEEVCDRLKLPNTYETLLLYASGLLADNDYEIDSSYNQCRIRSNEIVNAYLYQALTDAYKNYRIGRSPKFSIQESAVIKLIISSPIVDAHTQLNIVKNVENDRQVKMNGPVGLNVDEAYTIEKRAYSDSMQGLVSLNTTPSGEVGITRHLTLNANITDPRGFIEVGKKEYDGTELMSPGELMNTFLVESADAERVAMAISQTKHLVPVVNSSPSLITYDMGRVIPKIATDFSITADDDGEILDISEDIMIVKYKSGKISDIDMCEKADKNSDGGFYIMNKMETSLKAGNKFKKGDILAYNPKQINTTADMFGEPVATEGTLARIAIISDGSVFEDSTKVTQALAEKLSTYITISKNVVISKHSNIAFMVKKGDKIGANDPMLIFNDTNDEFTSTLLASMAEEAEDEDNIIATNAPVLSKVTGRIADIKIYYASDVAEMTPSLREIIKSYSSEVLSREKIIKKYMDPKDANTILTSSTVTEPDTYGKIKGIDVGDGILIQFYIEYLDVYGVGDKITHYGALKGINNDIIPLGYEGYAESDPDRKIDAYLSQIGVYKRMTLDVIKVGCLTKILIESKRNMKNKYLDRLKNIK